MTHNESRSGQEWALVGAWTRPRELPTRVGHLQSAIK